MAAMGIVFCHDDVTVFVKDINGKGEKICRIFGPGISSNFAIESGFFTVGHVFSMFLHSGFIKYNLMRTMQQQEEWLRLICRGGWCWMFGCRETMRNCWLVHVVTHLPAYLCDSECSLQSSWTVSCAMLEMRARRFMPPRKFSSHVAYGPHDCMILYLFGDLGGIKSHW
jgi:hypothetical protein